MMVALSDFMDVVKMYFIVGGFLLGDFDPLGPG
jgi:hypothetical protein